ncbi:hypothetical protein [Nocardia concava]|uniref:hypothetical protein n=1 Tax=Nocardia concava TaxID=257281 RepID=UPI001C3F2A1F|nr:hypothetical protein [Nocardia concava]
MLRRRLALPLGEPGRDGNPGGYANRREWFNKSRRLAVLQGRLTVVRGDYEAGRVHVVRGGRKLLKKRHNPTDGDLGREQWRAQWEARRQFLSADGESGKKFGNETLRVTPNGEISLRLPAPLIELANAPHGRYVLSARIGFAHRGREWFERVSSHRAVAYRIHYEVNRDRWYLTASWQPPTRAEIPLAAARASGVIAVDFNADHFAAYRIDRHGNPISGPRRFDFDMTGPASRRDAGLRHALSGILSWAKHVQVSSIAVEDLNFDAEKTREKHGHRKGFRRLLSGMPTRAFGSRLVSMAVRTGIAVIAVDPAYTSKWGAQHWRAPLSTDRRVLTRHDAAAIAIGRRALGHGIRRRTSPPHTHRSDGYGHRKVQAGPVARAHEGSRPPDPERVRDTCRRSDSVRGKPVCPKPFGTCA